MQNKVITFVIVLWQHHGVERPLENKRMTSVYSTFICSPRCNFKGKFFLRGVGCNINDFGVVRVSRVFWYIFGAIGSELSTID